MPRSILVGILSIFALCSTDITALQATQPSEFGSDSIQLPEAFRNYKTENGLTGMARRAQFGRIVTQVRGPAAAAPLTSSIAVRGTREIPVLLSKFSNTSSDPIKRKHLQKQLFDGPWSTGTLTDYYNEISNGLFKLNGSVFKWVQVPEKDTYYSGGVGWNGIRCPLPKCFTDPVKLKKYNQQLKKFGEYITKTLELADKTVDFSKYDNDGGDNTANSKDDDGIVDFVAIVHPEPGGECGNIANNDNLWSHRFSVKSLTGKDFETNDTSNSGKTSKVVIRDYVLMPALACDSKKMIEIGVFAHEFGHAFELPDLYDTDANNGKSAGIGSWGLMGSGSWGCDNKSPEKPCHMNAWSKEFLGWLKSVPISKGEDRKNVVIQPQTKQPNAIRIDIDLDKAYLLEYRKKDKFDAKLLEEGLLIWHINNKVIGPGLKNNKVNADHTNKGVGLIEADNEGHLDQAANRGDAGDPFPGSKNKVAMDSSTKPAAVEPFAICNIRRGNPSIPAQKGSIIVDIYTTKKKCP